MPNASNPTAENKGRPFMSCVLAWHRYSIGQEFAEIRWRKHILRCHILLSSILLSIFFFTFLLHDWVLDHVQDLSAWVCVAVVFFKGQGLAVTSKGPWEILLFCLSLWLLFQQLNVYAHCANVLFWHFEVFSELLFCQSDQILAFNLVFVKVWMIAFEAHFSQKLQYIFDGPLLYLCVSQVPSIKRLLPWWSQLDGFLGNLIFVILNWWNDFIIKFFFRGARFRPWKTNVTSETLIVGWLLRKGWSVFWGSWERFFLVRF